MKTKNLVTLAIALVLTVLLTVLCVCGVRLGRNIVIPALDGATLTGELSDASYIVYTMRAPAVAEIAEEPAEDADEPADETEAADEDVEATEAAEEVQRVELTDEEFAALADDVYTKLLVRAERQQVTGVSVTRLGEDKLRVEVPTTDVDLFATVHELIAIPGVISFRDDTGTELMSGDRIVNVGWGYSSEASAYIVSFDLDDLGREQFAQATTGLVGNTLSIYEDDQLLLSVSISEPLTAGSAALNFSTASSAYAVGYALGARSLPLELEETAEGTIPAKVAPAQWSRMLLVLGIVLLAVALALVIVHKGMGLAAAISLVLTVVCVLFFYGLVPYVTMSLATVYGIIAVAAVKLFCDLDLVARAKAGIASGSPVRSAVSSAFGVNIRRTLEFAGVMLVLALLMQYLGSASVKGFTSAMAIGSALACVLTMLVTRPLLMCGADLGK